MSTSPVNAASSTSNVPDTAPVALFATCFNDTMWPQTPQATVRLLERLDVRVEFPTAQTCCGQMFTNTGYADEAVPLVRSFVDNFSKYDAVVAPSGSCVGSVREQYEMLARRAEDPGLLRAVQELAPRVYELTEYLVDVLQVTDVGAHFPHRVTYHPTCHSLRMLRVGDRPLRLLRAVDGIDLVELPDADECCGFGGTFSVKNAAVSIAMGTQKMNNVQSTHAEYVVASDNSCLAQIGGLLGRRGRTSGAAATPVARPIHLAEVLASTREDAR